jgi:hypothetical protein
MRSGKLLRGTAIAAGLAAIAGFGIGFAAGKTEDPADAPQARRLPPDLCERLGDVSPLFPAKVELRQTGIGEVRCSAEVDEDTQPTYSGAQLAVTVQSYPPRPGSTAADVAREEYDDEPWQAVTGRPYPTKLNTEQRGEDSWHVEVLMTRGDLVVRVQYTASPVTRQAAESAAMTLAERAVWEAK